MTGTPVSSTITPPMRRLGRAALLLLVSVSLVAAGIPPALDEDRSVPGFCSPDCPLQQDLAHSVAVTPAAVSQEPAGLAVGPRLELAPPRAQLSTPASPDAPRAPPGA